jgi:hypothetical protein
MCSSGNARLWCNALIWVTEMPNLRFITLAISCLLFPGTATSREVPFSFGPAAFGTQPEIGYRSVRENFSLELSDSSLAMTFPDGSRLRMNLPRGNPDGLDPLPKAAGQTAARYFENLGRQKPEAGIPAGFSSIGRLSHDLVVKARTGGPVTKQALANRTNE